MDKLSNFGENLADMIFDGKLTPKTFSDAVGIDRSVVYKYLRNEILPTYKNLVVICDYFTCSADFILGLTAANVNCTRANRAPFCDTFKKLLNDNNLTRYKFLKQAKERGVIFAKQSVDDWFNGKRLPTVENLKIIANYFNCTIDYLLGNN